ncbi:MAG: type VI secretion system baseplate subunit TssK [Spongiibacteraceae bacterium]
MSDSNKTVWSEGMFLRPQHFQQQSRYMEHYVEGRCAGLEPYFFGFSELHIDKEPLHLGKLSITNARGVFPDGTPFSVPDKEELPPVLTIPENIHNETVYLCIPLRRSGILETNRDTDDQPQARFQAYNYQARDSSTASGEEAQIQIAKLRTYLKLGSEDLSGYAVLGVTRIEENSALKTAALDQHYIPPLVNCSISPPIKAYFEELTSLLKQRGDALSGRLTDSGRAGSAEVADYMLLQVINRVEPLLIQLSQQKNLHPLKLYTELIQIAGELSTFTSTNKRAPEFPLYQHDNLADTFASAIAILRQSLSTVLEQTALSLELVERKYGIYVAPITDRSLISSATFVLAAKADMQSNLLRNRLPSQAKVAGVEKIRELIGASLPGLTLRPLPVAPRQIPYHSGFTYFELEKSGPNWEMMAASGGFAVHLDGEYPGVVLELWAIRN